MGAWKGLGVIGPRTVKVHRWEWDDAPAAMPFGKTEPLFGPKKPPNPTFNPDIDGDGDSDINHDPIRKEDKPKGTQIPDASDDRGSGEDQGTDSSSDLPFASETDLPPANEPPTSTTKIKETRSPEETTTEPPVLNGYSTITWPPSETTTITSSGPVETYLSNNHPAEAHESTTSHSRTWITVTDMADYPSTTKCTTITHCSTSTLYPFETNCYYETTIPLAIEQDIVNDSQGLGSFLKDTGKLVAVILLTMVVSVLTTIGCIWAYKRRAKRRRGGQGGGRIGGDVEGGAKEQRKFWGLLSKRKERGTAEKTSPVRMSNTPVAEQAEISVLPEMAQRNQRLSIILPPGNSGHRQRLSNSILDRTLSTTSSLTVPPYPGSSAASGTTRSNSTRTARSVSSNTTDDTVVRAKREYRNGVNQFTEQNMHSDHAAVADGFHLAPPNPFDDDNGPRLAGAGGMGGSGVGVGGMGDVDGEGNRRVIVRPPPPIIRVGDVMMNPFEDPDMDLNMEVADGFSPHGGGGMMGGGRGMRHPPPPPPGLQNPFDDGLGGYPDVDIGMGDGFSGYVPGQMGEGMSGRNALSLERRVSMRGGDVRRLSGSAVSIGSSTSGESLSSNDTLRGDLEDWSGSGGGPGGHAGHS